ncbi:MAG: ferrous iron transport protein B [Deltaproteobacteria bacterium]|nr:ferrous iron transport protein B [Deltaproteobacteria bacterium]
MRKNITIALSGNPNSGKTTLFNAITGARQHIANYPGVTVEKKTGKINHAGYEITVVDLPGTYSLTAFSLEEIVARNFLVDERPDLVVDIVDASNLDRNLYLALQFKELGVPMIIALNMIDMSEKRGITIDYAGLSSLLGVPVVPMVARASEGITELIDRVIEVAGQEKSWQPELISYGMDIDLGIQKIEELILKECRHEQKYPSAWLALKCMEGDPEVKKLLYEEAGLREQIDAICDHTIRHIRNTLEDDPEGIIAEHRYGYIAGIIKKTVKRKIESRIDMSDRADAILTNRILGPIIMLTILYATYAFTFNLSETPVGWLESGFKFLKDLASNLLPEGNLQSLIISGIIDGVGGILSFVPLIMFMFLAIAVMEDSGYMARIAYMMDRVLRWFGLHGNSVMALIVSGGLSGGCAVPGVLATRTLRDPKERIATMLVAPFMNCGAKLPVFAILIVAFFAKDQARMMFIFTLMTWFFALFAAKILRSTVLRGPKTPFVMELPPYRAPTIKGIVIHTWERTWQYIKKAGTVILGVSIILWAAMTFPGLDDEQAADYEKREKALIAGLLSSPESTGLIKSREDLQTLDDMVALYSGSHRSGEEAFQGPDEGHLASIARAVIEMQDGKGLASAKDDIHDAFALKYSDYKNNLVALERGKKAEMLKSTAAGRLGRFLEGITLKIGFDYRTNIALIGGVAAKEVILSTLGTAYSLGDEGLEEDSSLATRLQRDPAWNPLVAFTLVLFIMLYVPCFVTLVTIAKEASWFWAGFSACFNLVTAFIISFIVYQSGIFLGIGV